MVENCRNGGRKCYTPNGLRKNVWENKEGLDLLLQVNGVTFMGQKRKELFQDNDLETKAASGMQ